MLAVTNFVASVIFVPTVVPLQTLKSDKKIKDTKSISKWLWGSRPKVGIVQKVFSPKGVPRIFDAFVKQIWRISDAFWNVPLFPIKQDPFWRIFDAFLTHSCYCQRLFRKHLLDDTEKVTLGCVSLSFFFFWWQANLRGPAAILFTSRDTRSDSIAKLVRACFSWGIAQLSRDTLQRLGIAQMCLCKTKY